MILELTTPLQDKYSNHLKKVIHKKLVIESDLEMSQTIEIVFYENIDQSFGRPLLQVIESDNTLTPEEKLQYSQRYKSIEYTAKTSGAYVNPANGELVFSENGSYPEGSVSELSFWQSLPISMFDGTTLGEKVYSAIKASMNKMIDRSRV